MRYPTLAFALAAVLVPAAALAGSHGTTTIEYGQNPAFAATGTITAPVGGGTAAYSLRATSPITVRVSHTDGGLFCAKVADVRVCHGPNACEIRKIGADGLCNFNFNDATFQFAQPHAAPFATSCMNLTSKGQNAWHGTVDGVAATAELRYKNGDVELVTGPKTSVALACDKADCYAPKVGPYVTSTYPPGSSIAPKATVGVPYTTTIWEAGWLAKPLAIVDPGAQGLSMYPSGVLQGTLTRAPTPPGRAYLWTFNAVFQCPSWNAPVSYALKIELPVNDTIGPHADASFEGDLTYQGGPMKVVAHVTDNWGVKLAAARFAFPDGHVTGLPLTRTGTWTARDQTWSAAFVEPVNLGSQPRVVRVKIVATDDDDNTTESADATYTVPARPATPVFPKRPPLP